MLIFLDKGDADFDRVSMDYIKKKLQSIEAKVLHRRRVNGGKFQYNKQVCFRLLLKHEYDFCYNYINDHQHLS